jgi:anti-sigma factor ChrR (cupin superfamily)
LRPLGQTKEEHNSMRVNADFSERVVIQTNELPWIASPQPGVERRMLDRIGDEVARATSLVRYAPASIFEPHGHALGEEFLVLDGIFSDEHGDYPAGTYVRNPPGSYHSPRTEPGCVILVKLRQMAPTERERIVIDTAKAQWQRGDADGHARLNLYTNRENGEHVTIERLAAGASLPEMDCPGGEEIFVLSGGLDEWQDEHPPGTWIRNPPGHRRSLKSEHGTVFWAKRGHLDAPR